MKKQNRINDDGMTDAEREQYRKYCRESRNEGVAMLAFYLVVPFVIWAAIGLYGISEGSNDLCTESFKGFVAWCVK